ncbi:hypothetical protein [Ruania alba]|uniref:Uncharacterized protein n=1 Tax=Ruania alba TaxID=648782 RepID=A0A1H5H3L4_9MICO|nr:hypothetical protein [Ruania alba]SEE22334.1 hypothetical protein SAMN04488554_1839 [Ruania alba]
MPLHDVEYLPGDPEAIEERAQSILTFAEALASADDFLRNTVTAELDSSAARSVEALRKHGESIGDQYRNASEQYYNCGSGLSWYAAVHKSVQEEMEPIVDRYTELDDLNVMIGPAAAGIDQDIPGGQSPEEVRAEMGSLRHQYEMLYQEWESALEKATATVGYGIVLSESELDPPSGLDKFLDWVSVGGTVLSVVMCWNPMGWGAATVTWAARLGVALTVAPVGVETYRYAQGEASAGDVLWVGAGAIPVSKFYKVERALPNGMLRLTARNPLAGSRYAAQGERMLDHFDNLSPETQSLLLAGVATMDLNQRKDGILGTADSAADLALGHTGTEKQMSLGSWVGAVLESSGPREAPDRSEMGPGR